MLAACGADAQREEETAAIEETGEAVGQSELSEEPARSMEENKPDQNKPEENADEKNRSPEEEDHSLLPVKYQPRNSLPFQYAD